MYEAPEEYTHGNNISNNNTENQIIDDAVEPSTQ